MSKFMSISEFREWEAEEFGKVNWIKDGISAVIGLPAVLTAASFGAAQGSVIGAAYVGIGFLTGAMIGGILGGGLFFLLAGIVAFWVFPVIVKQVLKLSRRLASGDFHYRYVKHLAHVQADQDCDNIILIEAVEQRVRQC